MKPLIAVLVLLVVLFASLFLFWGTKQPEAPALASSPSELAELRAELRALAQRVDGLQRETHLDSSGSGRLSQSDLDAAVERALAAHGDALPANHAETSAHAPAKLDAKSAFAQLTDPALDFEQRRQKWSELAKAGLLDEVLALYEKQAADNPNDAKAQTALGHAYLNKLFNSPQGPEAGVWGTKADKAFDNALAIDDHNWEARFSKAVSLSHWPPFLGKRDEAIQNFETLVQQQSEGPLKPHYADTYLVLGNLYKDAGNAEKALAMWQQGLALFPDNAEIQKHIQLAQHH